MSILESFTMATRSKAQGGWGFFASSIFLFALWLSLWPLGESAPSDLSAQVEHILRERIEKAGSLARIPASGEIVLAEILLPRFYRQRDFRPAWTRDGKVLSQVKSLIQALKNIDREGLMPADYHLAKIEVIAENIEKGRIKSKSLVSEALADLELLASDAFLSCGSHLAHGKVNPETLEVAWQGVCIDEEVARALERSLVSNRVEEELVALSPRHDFYLNLMRALSSLREQVKKKKRPSIPDGPVLQMGDRGKRVEMLRRRLVLLGDLSEAKQKPKDLFDEALEKALRRFQQRHGLDVTGSLDPATLAALNVPLEERIRQVELNLERWRWMPRDLGERFIYVNIANFELEIYENSRQLMAMKVVAGNQAWQTPDFSSQMTHLVINPYWTIPIPVVLKETIKYIQQDPNYLKSNKMVLLQGYGEDEKEINPAAVNWVKLNEKNLNFRIRQDPGPLNVLGRLKFVFPNKYEIFLHDTPYQEDFAKMARAFSHGCIRAEKPVELAAYVLQGKPGWDLQRILDSLDNDADRTVKLVNPINVYFLYGTAWIDEDGMIEFRPDIYERDKRLAAALSQKPPL